MTSLLRPTESSVINDRLIERLGDLGISAAMVDANGVCSPLGDLHPIERMILQSPAFRATVARMWLQLIERSGEAVAVWPGVYFVPLPAKRRRRSSSVPNSQVPVAILCGEDLLDSEHMLLLCDQNKLDVRAALQRIDRTSLLSSSEIRRMALCMGWMKQDSVELDRRVHELQAMSQHLAESYEELSLMYKLSSNMMVNQTPDSFLSNACTELQQVVGLRWMVLQIADHSDNLCVLAGQAFSAGSLPTSKRSLKKIGLQLIDELASSGKPIVLDDLSQLNVPGLQDLANHLLVVPLVRDGVPFGLIFGADKLDDSHISSIDSKLCSSLASTMSIFLQNAMLYEDMQSMFLGTLHALTSSIDAKDSYTHGHSERVALMSRNLAQAVGLDEATCERIYIAGLVHDVGKIGVPEQVLCKPGRLTFEEFELIKRHPEIGARILQDIRQMHDLIPGVLYHHERWDGNGYPHRLSGGDIPLFGRVIGLADAFDAMSTNRTYRRALKHEDVMAEIRRCSGTQFDPDLASVFLNLNFEPFFEMVQSHQAAHEHDVKPEISE
ncbi:MAG: HD domain-containing protein [Phycisphaeraceae bacterium]|nr:HD domain-containing protein [Phycisphaeraceae bacterium]